MNLVEAPRFFEQLLHVLSKGFSKIEKRYSNSIGEYVVKEVDATEVVAAYRKNVPDAFYQFLDDNWKLEKVKIIFNDDLEYVITYA